MSSANLFEQFLAEKQHLQNVSNHTLLFYKQSYKVFSRLVAPIDTQPGGTVLLPKTKLSGFVIAMRSEGISPATCNAYIRGINPFFRWLHENEFLESPARIKALKQESRVMAAFSEAQLKAIVQYKPERFEQERLHTLLLLLIDTGIRIGEALTLSRDGVDFQNLLIKVRGKGNKERLVPMSQELSKRLWKFLTRHSFELVFATRNGNQLGYNNVRRDFNALMSELEIKGFDGTFHAFRRTFARSYVKSGGNLFYLQKALGHTTLKMSRRYVEVETDNLSEVHKKVSLLSQLTSKQRPVRY